jgi:hypothetical protein
MSGIFVVDSIRVWLRRRDREKRLRAAKGWPLATGEVNRWDIVAAAEETNATGMMYQIEAGFHFILNGEYFGGYVHSVPMVRREADLAAKGTPAVHVRYDPANPDSVAVFAEDNEGNLPFRVFSD